MFKSISFKKKIVYAAVLFLLLIFALYKKNFSGIASLKAEINKMETLQTNFTNQPMQMELLQNRATLLNSSIGGTNTKPEEIQKDLLGFVSNEKYNLEITGVDEIHRSQKGGFDIYTNRLTVQGKYQDLIRFLYSLEKEFNKSKLVNVKFFTEKNYSNNRKKLYLTLIFQNYENKN